MVDIAVSLSESFQENALEADRLGRKLRIGYLSSYSANTLSPWAWSGTLFAIQRQLLLEGFDVVHLGNTRPASRWKGTLDRYLKYLVLWLRLPQPPPTRQRRKFMKQVHQKLREQPCDLILTAAATDETALLETDIPIVYLSDATAQVYYPLYNKMPTAGLAEAITLDHKTFNLVDQVIFPCEWAASSARQDYGIDPDKVKVLPFGANLEYIPTRSQVQKKRQATRPNPVCRLLFCGVEWERKGGAIAFETLVALRDAGVNAELIVVGTKPPKSFIHPHMRVVGYLDKTLPRQREVLEDLLWQSHFFLLPTRGDCYGIVCCEASAFGLPVLTTRIGGVPEVVLEGKNGHLFPIEATGQDYAARILELTQNPAQYEALVASSRQEYDDRLNWERWGQGFREIAQGLMASKV
jgi:glycosyltransferase involved in cell wall biosynthesis